MKLSRSQFLSEELKSENSSNIKKFLDSEYQFKSIMPPRNLITAAFDYFDPDDTKLVIIWQDPYHTPWVANGLAFSTGAGAIPPSLINIYKEICLEFDLNYLDYKNNLTWNLESRSKQWVLLLNNVLTVEAHKPLSHNNIWWQSFTDSVIRKLSQNMNWLVFILRWSLAQSKSILIDSSKHLVLKSPHPSPLSANRWFFGCWHFQKANEYLISQQKDPIKRI